MPGPVRIMILTAALFAVAPVAAQAADFTASNVTAPAPTTITLTDAHPTFPAIGTTSGGTTGTALQLRCYYNAGVFDVLGSATTVAGGGFTTTAAGPAGECRLRAVPADLGAGADPSAFTGPLITVLAEQTTHISGGANDGALVDALDTVQGTTGFADWSSLGAPFALVGWLTYADGTASDLIFDGVGGTGGVTSADGDPGNRTPIQVDGHNAFAPAAAATADGARTGLQALTHTPAPGGLSSTETDPLVRCATDDVLPAGSASTCGNWTATGVQIARTTTAAAGGETIHVADVLTSTDAQSHALSLAYRENLNTDGAANVTLVPSYRLPGEDSFATRESGNAIGLNRANASTVFIRTARSAADGDPVQPLGAITFSPGLDLVEFLAPNTFLARFDHVVVPATGSTTISTTYEMRTALADLKAATALDEDGYTTPSVAITDPAPGSGTRTTAAQADIRGTATGGNTLTLAVNGAPVTINPDGSWDATVPVAKGPNTYTALLTNGAGNTDTAKIDVFGAVAAAAPVARTRDTTPPVLALARFPKTVTQAKLTTAIKGTARCSETCSIDAQLVGTPVGGHIARAGDVVLATKSVALDLADADPTLPPPAIAVALHPSRKLAVKVRVGAKLRIVVLAIDASANRTTRTETVKVVKTPAKRHKARPKPKRKRSA